MNCVPLFFVITRFQDLPLHPFMPVHGLKCNGIKTIFITPPAPVVVED